MKYKYSDKIISSAELYASKSLNFTYDWSGFESDTQKNKFNRIKRGKIAEYWTAEYCFKHGVPYVLDTTSYTQSDDIDIKINGVSVDCKSTISGRYYGQVQPSHDTGNKKDTRGEYYSFYIVDELIEPLGFIEKEWLIESSDKVFKGENIRGGAVQRHDPYSYFIKNPDSLINFELFVKNGMKHK